MNPTVTTMLAAALSIAATAGAQGLHVVPSAFTSQDAPGTLVLPGLTTSWRMQIVIASAELTGLTSRNLTGIAFRRDHDDPIALDPAQGRVVVRIGAAASEPLDVAADFTANLPSPLEVFRGPITAPASAANPTSLDWSPPNVVEIAFATPFPYAGGPLCIEIESVVPGGHWWPVDAAEDGRAGAVTSVGLACGPYAWLGDTAWAASSSLTVGRTAVFGLIGQPSAPCWLLVGLGTLAQPVDLGPIGLPGCELRVAAFTALATSTSPAVQPPELTGGGANVRLHVPNVAGLAGASLAVQWAELGAAVATSNTLECAIASTPPSAPITLVTSRDGEPPTVQSAVVPVIGLRHD